MCDLSAVSPLFKRPQRRRGGRRSSRVRVNLTTAGSSRRFPSDDAAHRDRTRRVDTAGHSESVTSISVLSRAFVLCASAKRRAPRALKCPRIYPRRGPDKRKRRGRAVTGRAMTYELPGSLCRLEYRLNWGTRAIKGLLNVAPRTSRFITVPPYR